MKLEGQVVKLISVDLGFISLEDPLNKRDKQFHGLWVGKSEGKGLGMKMYQYSIRIAIRFPLLPTIEIY